MKRCTNEEFDDAMERYYKKFGEYFPTECGMDNTAAVIHANKAIEKGEPYDPNEELRKRGIDPDSIVW